MCRPRHERCKDTDIMCTWIQIDVRLLKQRIVNRNCAFGLDHETDGIKILTDTFINYHTDIEIDDNISDIEFVLSCQYLLIYE
jgi:hypothetical protein